MTPHQWGRLKDLFEQALQCAPEELEPFLGKVKETEPLLSGELQRLLAEYQSSPEGLQQPALLTQPEPADDPLPRFSAGTVLAQRFRIVAFLARGGMGEVYEAEDLQLGEAVALKAIRPDIARNPRAAERLKQEVQLARKVTHPNVCRIFDLIRLQDGTDLLSMELVRGETLSAHLKRNGPMTPQHAAPLVAQLAAALEAAHEAGVIHGDLKPGNVILAPGKNGTRAVIMDFGLALSVEAGQRQMRDGTPDYMAPEQREGGPVTTATDIYAFGMVIRDMAGAAVWSEVQQRCLQHDPALRYGRPAEVAVALRGAEGFLLRRSFGIAAATGMVGLMLTQPWRARPVPFKQGSWVMLEAFENRTGEPGLDSVLRAALERELQNSQVVSVAERQRVVDALRLIKKPPDMRLDRALAREVALRDRGIAVLITGKIEKAGSGYLLTAVLVDPADNSTLRTVAEIANGLDQILPVAHRLSNLVRQSLGERIAGIDLSNRQMEKVTTPSIQALRAFDQAYLSTVRNEWPEAERFSRQALADDPEFASAHIWLAWALRNQARPEWEQAARRSLELSPTATERERLFIEASNLIMAQQHARAMPILENLVRLHPDHYFGWMNLANIYTRQGRAQDAARAVSRVADMRPNDFDSQANASQRFLFAQDLPAAVKHARQAVAALQPGGPPGTPLGVGVFFTPFTGAFKSGSPTAVAELETVVAQAESVQDPQTFESFAWRIAWCQIALGRIGRAREWMARIQTEQLREEMAASIAFGLGQMEEAKARISAIASPKYFEIRLLGARFIPSAASRILAANLAGRAGAKQAAPPKPVPAGNQLALLEAARGLMPENLMMMQVFAEPLAEAWEREGRLDRAIEILEQATGLFLPEQVFGVRNRALLAQYYRRQGRRGEASVIEDYLRNILSAADLDFPLLKQLQR